MRFSIHLSQAEFVSQLRYSISIIAGSNIFQALTMMLQISRFCTVSNAKGVFEKLRITSFVYMVIFLFLILFSIFNTLITTNFRPRQPQAYDIENVVIQHISCSFPLSGQYHKAPRCTFYLLSVFTIIIRNHEWLAVSAAASALTYTGVAAIHLVILFWLNNEFDLSKTKTHCEYIPLPGAGAPFLACAGVEDPDIAIAMNIVSSAMLGALPIAVWSTTFRKSTSKPILIYWLLLLAVGHLASTWSVANPNRHFQICSKDRIEPLPGPDYQAPLLDQVWRSSLHSLVTTAQQSSQALGNRSSPPCTYSCFATTGYAGRRVQDIGAYELYSEDTSSPSASTIRHNSVLFWWAYTILALLTLFTERKENWVPHWAQKPVFSAEYRHRPLASRWEWKIVTYIAIAATCSSATTSTAIHITLLSLVQITTRLASVAAFCGSIIFVETANARKWKGLEQEPFTAVGQWSCLATVFLVLLAAGVSRMGAGRGALSENESNIEHAENDWDAEAEKEYWNCRVGYAS